MLTDRRNAHFKSYTGINMLGLTLLPYYNLGPKHNVIPTDASINSVSITRATAQKSMSPSCQLSNPRVQGSTQVQIGESFLQAAGALVAR